MNKIVFQLLLLCLYILPGYSQSGQPKGPVNLVKNGDFEKGNAGFRSDFTYNMSGIDPGEYTITYDVEILNPDLRNPATGDHTSGDGYFMVVNSNDQSGRQAWCGKVNVIPNSMYNFSAYFCNLYRHLPSNVGFIVNGMQVGGERKGNDPVLRISVNNKQIGEIDKDIYHMFHWLNATAEWYSGSDSGLVDLCIENVNTSSHGNDLALDDIEFYYVKTMPKGYKHIVKNTIMSDEYLADQAEKHKYDKKKPIAFHELAKNREKGDSIAPGIYTIRPKSKPAPVNYSNHKIVLHNLIFEQGKTDLLPAAKEELNQLADWMKKNSNVRIRLEGHTDNNGDPELNVKLSEERVAKAKAYLMQEGIDAGRIEGIGYGGAHPVADNANEETRKLNRRIEFEVIE